MPGDAGCDGVAMSADHTPTRDRYVILIRNPRGGQVFIIQETDDDQQAAVFASEDEAQTATVNVPVIVAGWPYSIVRAP